eukprot:TRINITY_DN76577_c0_g1_i1.p1 TRINITY_DN76577_c0_g1~~TRINITY_DN76577_c0_g1_i1.p1  ORF type:complete len:274 (+),score=38.33 TRINITY_DN76577_c0_g1_i1:122-943(+)
MDGNRLIFFLDECSLLLRGDAVEYCAKYAPNSLECIKEIPALCSKFSKELWPLVSKWAPLERSSLVSRLAQQGMSAQRVCFRSLHAGLAPWRRPVTKFGMWASDENFAPAMRLFRSLAIARLNVHDVPEQLSLVAALKSTRRTAENRGELLQWLSEEAGHHGLAFNVLIFSLSLAQQVKLMASAKVFVASAGSSQFAGLFLPPNARVLLLPMCASGVEPGKVSCFSEELLACCVERWEEYRVSWNDTVFTVGRGFDFVVRRSLLQEALRRLLA